MKSKSHFENSIKQIAHLEEIKTLRNIEQYVYQKNNLPVYDISHWNSGSDYKKMMLSTYTNNLDTNIFDYRYSYEYNSQIKQKIIEKTLCNSPDFYNCTLLQSTTTAICCIVDFLKKNDYKNICVLEPAYFSIYSCLTSFGLNVYKEYIILDENDNCIFPFQSINDRNYDVVWITSPIFSTGIYYTKDQIKQIIELLNKNILVILDESIASIDKLLYSQLPVSKNVISIYSPPKYLSINSQKFAVIICSKQICAYLEDWVDVFIGSLPLSTHLAIEHFLSNNYMDCIYIHDRYIQQNMSMINQLIKVFPNNAYKGESCNYITICNKSETYFNKLDSEKFLQIMLQTNTSFIPGYINDFSKEWGVCFRVNLTHNVEHIKFHLGRLLNYFG